MDYLVGVEVVYHIFEIIRDIRCCLVPDYVDRDWGCWGDAGGLCVSRFNGSDGPGFGVVVTGSLAMQA